MIFSMLFFWLPLIIFCRNFWINNINDFYVEFDLRSELEYLAILFVPLVAVIAAVVILEDYIDEYVWSKKNGNSRGLNMLTFIFWLFFAIGVIFSVSMVIFFIWYLFFLYKGY